MSDAADLVAVVGELDREIDRLDADHAAQARAAAATLIPPLGDPSTAGWYDRLLDAGRAEPPVTSLDEGLERLALEPESRAALGRRVIVAGAVARALPERFGPEGDSVELILLALSGPGILRSAPEVGGEEGGERTIRAEAPEFLTLLVDREVLPDLGAYREFLAVASDRSRDLVHNDLLAAPPPCSTQLVEVPLDGAGGVALALVTSVCVTGVTLADVAHPGSFMNPARWADYSHWCAMVADPGNPAEAAGAARFLEVVALDCPHHWLEVAVWLDVSPLMQRPDALIRTYRMSADQKGVVGGMGANGAVNVDEGSIKVGREAGHLRVTTTKRVRFTAVIDHGVLAVIACVAGYGALATAFVVEGTSGMAQDVACAGPSPLLDGTGAAAEVAGDPVRQRIDAFTRSVEECVSAARASFTRVAAGTYTADDVAGDVAGYVVRNMRVGTRLVELLGSLSGPRPVRPALSDPVTFQPPGAGPCTVGLVGPMASPHGDLLPVEQVRFVPASPLAAGSRTFSLAVTTSGLRGTTYLGRALITDVPTGGRDEADLDVQIP